MAPLASDAGVAAPTAVGGTPRVDLGVGSAAMKSALLSLVSTEPPPASTRRTAAVVFDSVGAAADPSKHVGGSVPDEVERSCERTRAGQRASPPRPAQLFRSPAAMAMCPDRVRGGQRKRAAAAGRLLNEVIAARGNHAGQRRDRPRRSCSRRVLHRPARDADVEGLAIAQLDEVVAEVRSAVASASVDLADDDVGRWRDPPTASAIVASRVRPSASAMETGSEKLPVVTVGDTVNEKTLSPAVTSPTGAGVARRLARCTADRRRSAVTAMPVLGGLAAGDTVTVSSDESAGVDGCRSCRADAGRARRGRRSCAGTGGAGSEIRRVVVGVRAPPWSRRAAVVLDSRGR